MLLHKDVVRTQGKDSGNKMRGVRQQLLNVELGLESLDERPVTKLNLVSEGRFCGSNKDE